MKKQYKKALAAALAVSLAWNLIPNIPYVHASQTSHYIVDDIETLPDDILYQQVEFGTEEKDLKLPDTLGMLVRSDDEEDWDGEYIETAASSNADKATPSDAEKAEEEEDEEETAAPSTATSSNAEDTDGDWRMVRVEWVLNERFSEAVEYDGEQPGIYVFDAEFVNDRYSVGDALLPTIEVEVLEEDVAGGLEEKQILSWQWVDPEEILTETEDGKFLLPLTASRENPAGPEDITELLPKEITARVAYSQEIAGEDSKTGAENVMEETISLAGWSCMDYPEAGACEGEYTFTAKLPEGCKLAEGAPELEVQVQFQGVVLLADGYGKLLREIWQTHNDVKVYLYDTNGDEVGDCVVISGNSEVYLSISDTGWNVETKITSVIIEEGVTSIGKEVCSNMLDLETVTIPSTVSSIGDRAFYQCWNLKDVKISKGVQSIGEEAFSYCMYSLTSISIPEGVESIGAQAFYECEALTSVSLPDTLKTVGYGAFVWCPIEKVIIPENVSEIGIAPFYDAKTVYNLSDVDIGQVSEKTEIETVYTITRKGRDGEADRIQKVLPSGAAAGTRYKGTAYDAASYFPDGNGNSWVAYDEESGTYTEVTEETADAVLSGASGTTGNPVLYPVRAISWDDINVEANHVGGDKTSGNKTYTLTVKDNSTGVTLEEEIHYTAVITSVNGFDTESGEATSDGTQPGRVTVTITGIPEGGYMGTREVSYLVSEVASVKIGEDGEEILYTSLSAAFASVGDDQTATITLLENAAGDVTVSGNVTLTSKGDKEVEISGTVTVPSGASLALMSDTVTISATSDEIAYGVCVTGGAFVMEAGAVQAVTTGYSRAYGIDIISGTAEIRGGTITAGGTIQQWGGYGVYADRGTTLSVTDGNISSDGVGLFISSDNISLSGGTVSGEYAAVYIAIIHTSNTVGGILEKGYVYYDSDGAYAVGVNSTDSSLPAGTYTIGACTEHEGAWEPTADHDTHTRTCERCGEEEIEAHTFGEDNRCTKCTMQAAASVAIDGEETAGYYTSVEKAWAAAQGKTAVITLLADAEVSEVLTVTAGSKITWQSDPNHAEYTISGNVNEANGGLINIASGGSFTLDSGIIINGSGGTNAIAVNDGSFVMNGGTATALADGHSGVCVYSGGTADINGGSASGYNGLAIVNGGSGTVSGGTFTGTFPVSKGSAAVLLRNMGSTTLKSILGSIPGEEKAYYDVKDGTKTLITDLTGTSLYGTVTVDRCEHSYGAWTDSGDGTTHRAECVVCGTSVSVDHSWDESGKCTVCAVQAEASVKIGDAVNYYRTIEKAWAYAQENSSDSSPATVTLLADAIVTGSLTVEEGGSIIFTGDDTLSSDGVEWAGVIVVNGGNLRLMNGTIESCSLGIGLEVNGGTFTMEGGAIVSDYTAIFAKGGSVTISDGSITGGYGLAVEPSTAMVKLSGGTYTGTEHLYFSVGSISSPVEDYLAEGFAYRQDGEWVNDTTVYQLTGRVIVEEAPIKSVEATADKETITATGQYENVAFAAQVELSSNYTDSDVTYRWFENGHLIADAKEWISNRMWQPGSWTFTCEATCDGYTITSDAFVLEVRDPNAEVISVDVTWGKMEFTYTDGAWNPETHTYGDGGWTAAENGDQITVKNSGKIDVTVSYSYEKIETDISGSFADETGHTVEAHKSVALSVGQERKTYLKLSGKPASGFTTGTLGMVKVTIGGGE